MSPKQIAVGNMSGWVWALLALAGSWMGVELRPLFGLQGRAIVRAKPGQRADLPPDVAPSC
jgi:hypothetical protein